MGSAVPEDASFSGDQATPQTTPFLGASPDTAPAKPSPSSSFASVCRRYPTDDGSLAIFARMPRTTDASDDSLRQQLINTGAHSANAPPAVARPSHRPLQRLGGGIH